MTVFSQDGDETRLIAALQDGNKEALAFVFDTYANQVYRVALGILHDEQAADGVVQETFLALIEHIDTFEGRARLSTWLYRVAYNNCLGRLRKVRPHVDLPAPEDNDSLPLPENMLDWRNLPETLFNQQEVMAQIDNALAQLSPKLQVVFVMRDMEGLSTEETAAALGISLSTVKVRLHRARLALRELLAAYFDEHLND